MSRPEEMAWTIDELSALANVPTRTIREYRTVGVMAPPVKRGRVGFYDRSHLERLRLVGRLKARGYSLAGIRDLLDSWQDGRTLGTLLSLDEPGPGVLDEVPVSLSAEEISEALPGLLDSDRLDRAEEVGIITRHGDRYAVRSVALLRLVAEATALGVGLDDLLDFVASFRSAAREQARGLTTLFVDQVWDPEGDMTNIEPMARRARLLIAQAAASMVVHELGEAVFAAAGSPEGRGLDQLAAAVRIGVMEQRDSVAQQGDR